MSTKRKLTTKVAAPVTRANAKATAGKPSEQSRTVVTGGGKTNGQGREEVVEISSGEEESEDEEEEEENEAAAPAAAAGDEKADVDMGEATSQNNDNEEGDGEAAEPSFGDLVRVNASEPIDVAGAFDDPSSALTFPKGSSLAAPSGASLGTVLTQALKTNDVSLLESCLHTTDLSTIRATIQRLDSPLAAILLGKLAERLHRRPGRAGSLMVWIQWTLVTHGGYLATQPDLIKKLAELNRVIEERARGLGSLLALKGKLDMLEAQMQLRRAMRDARRGGVEVEGDEEGVVYVEGEDSDEDMLEDAEEDDEDDSEEDMPNGLAEEDDESDDEEADNMIDDEAEETDAESAEEDDIDHDDQDDIDDSGSDEETPARGPPAKMQRVSGLFGRKK